MDKEKANTFFVYRCLKDGSEILYESGLSEMDAYRSCAVLDFKIINGLGDSWAIIGDLNKPSDRCVAKRLGLIE